MAFQSDSALKRQGSNTFLFLSEPEVKVFVFVPDVFQVIPIVFDFLQLKEAALYS